MPINLTTCCPLTKQHLGYAGPGFGAEESICDGIVLGAAAFDKECVAVSGQEAISKTLNMEGAKTSTMQNQPRVSKSRVTRTYTLMQNNNKELHYAYPHVEVVALLIYSSKH